MLNSLKQRDALDTWFQQALTRVKTPPPVTTIMFSSSCAPRHVSMSLSDMLDMLGC
jgi:hypothetical protein